MKLSLKPCHTINQVFILSTWCSYPTLHSPGGFVHRREMQLAHISLVIVLVFVLSHSVKWIPNIWEFRKAQLGQVADKLSLHINIIAVMFQLDTEFPPLISSITELSHLMTVFNRWVIMLVIVMMIMMMMIVMMMMMLPSSANFYIYLIKHRCSRGGQQGETIVMGGDTTANTVLVRPLLHANCRTFGVKLGRFV